MNTFKQKGGGWVDEYFDTLYDNNQKTLIIAKYTVFAVLGFVFIGIPFVAFLIGLRLLNLILYPYRKTIESINSLLIKHITIGKPSDTVGGGLYTKYTVKQFLANLCMYCIIEDNNINEIFKTPKLSTALQLKQICDGIHNIKQINLIKYILVKPSDLISKLNKSKSFQNVVELINNFYTNIKDDITDQQKQELTDLNNALQLVNQYINDRNTVSSILGNEDNSSCTDIISKINPELDVYEYVLTNVLKTDNTSILDKIKEIRTYGNLNNCNRKDLKDKFLVVVSEYTTKLQQIFKENTKSKSGGKIKQSSNKSMKKDTSKPKSTKSKAKSTKSKVKSTVLKKDTTK